MAPPNLVDPGPGTPTRQPWAVGVHAWITYLNSLIGGTPTTVVNGSFEQYTGINNVPDNWVFTAFTTGAGALDNSKSADGLYSFKITCLGGGGSNGGGQLDSYVSAGNGILVPVNPLEDFWASWYYYTNLATLSNKVEVLWYQENGAASAITPKSTLWSASSGQPVNTWTQNAGTIATASIPSDARFYSLRFTGGVAGAAAGIVWYDNVKSGFQPQLRGVSQLFTSSGTFTVPGSNVFRVRVQVYGASGAGVSGSPAAGGGGGGYSESYLNVVPNQVLTVTIGNPNTCGGPSVTSGATGSGATGGAGGVASGGVINKNGGAGQSTSGSAIAAVGGRGALGAPAGGAGGFGTANQAGETGSILISY